MKIAPRSLRLVTVGLGLALLAGCDSSTPEPEPVPDPDPVPVTGIPGDPNLHTELVDAHNQVRQTVGLPALQWSQALGDFAQEWAEALQAQGCPLQHRQGGQFGENLASSTGTSLAAAEVVGLWASEEAFYDYDSNTCQSGQVCGHYTQIVWRNSQTIGCGRAQCGQTEVWVCNYDPPGNIVGQKPY